jgi:predicted exporter
MVLTAAVVTIGFFTLSFSEFNGLVQLGTITGVSLIAAMFGDLFLSPLLVSRFGAGRSRRDRRAEQGILRPEVEIP